MSLIKIMKNFHANPRHVSDELVIPYEEVCGRKELNLWTSSWSEAETAASLILRYHASPFACVDSF